MNSRLKNRITALLNVMGMEFHNIIRYPVYWFCMLLLPLFVIFFFTDVMHEGLPEDMPVGVVDLDNSSTSRKLLRKFDSFQNSHIAARYQSVSEARRAMQDNEIYAFMYFPENMSRDLISGRQPKISFYYNNSVLLAGSLVYKEMRAISTMGAAAVVQSKMQAKGYTDKEIMGFIQPILTDVHAIDNPWLNYNVYLSNVIVPACLAIFIFLMTAYTIGVEIKFERARGWMRMAGDNVYIAITGKMLPQTIVFTCIVWFYQYWLFCHLAFPHGADMWQIFGTGWFFVMACQGFGIFIFGILPSLRMSMSVCALWAVLSFSISGFSFPVDAMDKPIHLLSWLFPMRSYFMIYQINILHGFPVYYAWGYYVALLVFTLMPLTVLPRIGKVLKEYEYIP